jgi:hypothetical protein
MNEDQQDLSLLAKTIYGLEEVLAAELRLANENPGREMQVTFRTEDDGKLTGVLRVVGTSNSMLAVNRGGFLVPVVTCTRCR